MSIYVGNLSYDVTQEDLSEVFQDYGTVKRVQLPTDRETGRPRGFGFVEMSTEEEEEKAINALDGAEWMGRDIRVNKAKPREDRKSGGGYSNRRGGGGGRY
ncbi:RNA recognition motif domain-containing protein [Dapis sp. BLCC M172]|uniref:RNA recognition motif domain-containing protein n=1 Tax=Dapis sp. BLCC M172 TaxID=2975281 RepID=UPI003CFB90F8